MSQFEVYRLVLTKSNSETAREASFWSEKPHSANNIKKKEREDEGQGRRIDQTRRQHL